MDTAKLGMKIDSKTQPYFLLLLIGVYAMLFEWRSIFERPYFIFTANMLKIAIPAVFLLFLLEVKRSPEYAIFRPYGLFFVLFMSWGLISSLFSPELYECIIQWAKYVPLLLFCCFICLYMLKNKRISEAIMKFFVVIAVLIVVQYVILTIVSFHGPVERFSNLNFLNSTYLGPFGLLGQGLGQVYFSPMKLSLFQLYGFWMEPAKAAGFLLASVFFAEIIFFKTRKIIWKIAKFACFLGGVATFSNTAYLCIGMVGLLGEIFWLMKSEDRKLFHLAMCILFILVSLTAVFGRYFVAKYYPTNMDLRYIIGVRDAVNDPYSGRIELFNSNIAAVKESPLMGIGFRIAGKNEQGQGYTVSSHVMGYWLTFTGIVGIMLLMLREFQIIRVVAKNMFSSVYILRASQAWLAFFTANLTYGTLMDPFYFITVAIVFSSIRQIKERVNIG